MELSRQLHSPDALVSGKDHGMQWTRGWRSIYISAAWNRNSLLWENSFFIERVISAK